MIQKRKQFKTLIVFATMLEARPFMDRLELDFAAKWPYPVFEQSDQSLAVMITGVGKLSAAIAMRYFFLNFDTTFILNCGLVGSLVPDGMLGELVGVESVVDVALHGDKEYEQMYALQGGGFAGLTEFVLATVDEPVFEPKVRDELAMHAHVVDMEGFSIVRIAQEHQVPVAMLKVISDFADGKAKELIKERGQEFCKLLAEKLYEEVCDGAC